MKISNLYFDLVIWVFCDIFRLCSVENVSKLVYVKEPPFVRRVVGGSPAILGEMPYQVGFKKLKHRRHSYYTFCGGVIIRGDKLLSAAHCFVTGNVTTSYKVKQVPEGKLKHIYAVAGSLFNHELFKRDSDDYTEQWRLLKLVLYPGQYKFPLKSDIAVVMILSAFIYNPFVNKIGYARHYSDYIGSCLTSGYGRLSKQYKVQSDILLKARLVLLPDKYCSRKFYRDMKDLVCTAMTSTDIAKGDSGGPLVCFGTREYDDKDLGVLVGIASGSKLGVATFYTRVSSYAKFIEENNAESYTLCSIHLFMYILIALAERFLGYDLVF